MITNRGRVIIGFYKPSIQPEAAVWGLYARCKPDGSRVLRFVIFRFSSIFHCSFLFRCNNRLFTDILADLGFNKRVCECLLPANHPSQNIAMYNKTISWRQTPLLTYWKITNLLFRISNSDVAKNAHRQNEETNIPKTNSLSISWTCQEPRGLVGSRISDRVVPGSNSTAVSSFFFVTFLFFLKVRTAKNFKVFHMFSEGLRTCTSELYTYLSGGYYRDLQTSGQSMCSNGRLAIETSIKNLMHITP